MILASKKMGRSFYLMNTKVRDITSVKSLLIDNLLLLANQQSIDI